MAQYIDKEKVETILRNLWKEDDGHNPEHRICYNKALQEVQCEIDTIEVKEVDLEKEIDEVIHNYKLNNHRHTSICSADIEWIAEHFFELGIKVQTNIKMTNLDDIFIENGIDPNSKQAKIFKESYYTALENLKYGRRISI